MRAGDDALQVADADATADRIVDPHDAVAELMQAARFFVRGAVGDVLAVEVFPTTPLAVPMAVEAEVQAGTEVEPSCRQRSDREVTGRAVRPSSRAARRRAGDG